MLSASIPSGVNVSVLAAPIVRASGVAASATASAASLWGIVTLAPMKPAPGSAANGLVEELGRHGQQLVGPAVEPGFAQRRALHRGRAAVADRPAEHAQARHRMAIPQQFLGFLPPLAARAALYFATSDWNFASVDENAWPPLPHGLTT